MELIYHVSCSIYDVSCVIKYSDMSLLVLAYFVPSYILIIVFGYLQTHVCLPNTQVDTRTSEVYSVLGLALICIQAFVSVVIFSGTALFPLAALFLAFTLLCHHAVIHRNSRFEGEACSCSLFQLKDISNHETWVMASLVAAVVSWGNL